VRLLVQILAAHRAQARAIGAVQDLLRQLERERVARPRREIEGIVRDVRRLKLLVAVQVVNGFLLPITLFFVWRLAASRQLMGGLRERARVQRPCGSNRDRHLDSVASPARGHLRRRIGRLAFNIDEI